MEHQPTEMGVVFESQLTATVASLTLSAQESELKKIIIEQLEKYEHLSEGQSQIIELFEKYTANQKTNRALGCLFGCLIGDALGAFCEFLPKIQSDLLQKTMTMPGGGTFNLRVGQYTDDSELAFHLLSALNAFDAEKPLKDQQFQLLRLIALEYMQWDQSGPFDIGQTCSKGLCILERHDKDIQTGKQIDWETIFKQILKYNSQSESNGSLMRIQPMAIFLSLLNQSPSEHTEFIKNQIGLMHPNPILKAAGTVWVTALTELINRRSNKSEEFQEIWQKTFTLPESQLLYQKGWYGRQNLPKEAALPGNVNMGWAKIAWTYGMRILKSLGSKEQGQLESDFYRNEIQWVISRAGDTDTNACIVGGMIGAIIGFTKLPIDYLQKIFSLRFPIEADKVTDRPFHYEPLNVLVLALRFMQKCQHYNAVKS